MAKRKGQTMIYKTKHRKLKIELHESHRNTGGELRCFGRISSSCSTHGTCRVTLVSKLAGFKLTTLVVNGTECVCSCRSK